ncbi:MAG: 5-(carboxyamino)imidazole ribonucleotide mutase [Gammaproteobacteria bacterium]|nr:5-(carboxyamino)imidazole ribonucleotide mutase [Gammaproteobacteria bacterium]
MPARVGIVMGSHSDWSIMSQAADTLEKLGIEYETRVHSAHRSPEMVSEYARTAIDRGLEVIIAGAGGAAHLPGVIAGQTRLPVLGVPIPVKVLDGLDSLLSIVQMPAGIPVGTLAIGNPGAKNAALLAAAILALKYPDICQALEAFRAHQTEKAMQNFDPSKT